MRSNDVSGKIRELFAPIQDADQDDR